VLSAVAEVPELTESVVGEVLAAVLEQLVAVRIQNRPVHARRQAIGTNFIQQIYGNEYRRGRGFGLVLTSIHLGQTVIFYDGRGVFGKKRSVRVVFCGMNEKVRS